MQIQPPIRTFKQTISDWKNLIVHVHDNICQCNKPLEHTIDTCTNNPTELRLNKSTKQQLQQCLSTREEDGPGDVIDGFEDGELDALFAQDTEEDTG